MTVEQVQPTRLPLKIIRGGSSKGIFVRSRDLPPPGMSRDKAVLRLFGAPDVRQIDGLGGADKLTSKLAVMGPPTRSDCDISYLFAQVGTEFPDVDWTSNCGNISGGAALYAALERVGTVSGAKRHISIEQANTGRRLLATVPLNNDAPALTGDFRIGGVPGTGPRIDLDFADFDGSCLGQGVFPTGARQELLILPDQTAVPVTILDMANLNVLARAEDLGLDLTCPLDRLQGDKDLLDRLDMIRAAVMLKLKMAEPETVMETIRRSLNPLVQILARPQYYKDLAGQEITAESHDLLSRSYSRRAFSKAFPGTGAIGTALGTFTAGTLAECFGQNAASPSQMRIGHPGGCLTVDVTVSETGGQLHIAKASIGRTARVLLEGTAHLD